MILILPKSQKKVFTKKNKKAGQNHLALPASRCLDAQA